MKNRTANMPDDLIGRPRKKGCHESAGVGWISESASTIIGQWWARFAYPPYAGHLSSPRVRSRIVNGASRPRPAPHPLSRAIASALLPASLALGTAPALAGPEGEQVIAGQAAVSRPDAKTTVIDQFSDRAILGWSRFDLAADELAKFNQPSASSVILNRIGGQDPSQIFGAIEANGQVFLVNPRGIFFSKTAQISAASFLASTLNIADEDFMAGNYTFAAPDGVDPGAIINYGLMEAATGGSVTLMGGAVREWAPFYVASGRRDSTPEEEVEYLQSLLEVHSIKYKGWLKS